MPGNERLMELNPPCPFGQGGLCYMESYRSAPGKERKWERGSPFPAPSCVRENSSAQHNRGCRRRPKRKPTPFGVGYILCNDTGHRFSPMTSNIPVRIALWFFLAQDRTEYPDAGALSSGPCRWAASRQNTAWLVCFETSKAHRAPGCRCSKQRALPLGNLTSELGLPGVLGEIRLYTERPDAGESVSRDSRLSPRGSRGTDPSRAAP